MAETAPNPSSPQPAGPSLPPIDPKAIIDTAIAVLKAPADFFRSIKDEKGFQKGLVFAVAMSLISAILTSVYSIVHGFIVSAIISIVVTTLIGGIVGPFIGAFILWAICMAFGSKATWERAFPIAAYSMAVQPAVGLVSLIVFVSPGLVALVSLVVWLYALYICYVGAKTLMFDPAPQATPTA